MVTDQDMVAAQVITGAAMAAFLAAGWMGPRGRQVRVAVLVLYLAAAVVMVGVVLGR